MINTNIVFTFKRYEVESSKIVQVYDLHLTTFGAGESVDIVLSSNNANYEARFTNQTGLTTNTFSDSTPIEVHVFLTTPNSDLPGTDIKAEVTGGASLTNYTVTDYQETTILDRVSDIPESVDITGVIKYTGSNTSDTLIGIGGLGGVQEYLIVKDFTPDDTATQRVNPESLYYLVNDLNNVLSKIITTRVTNMNELFLSINNNSFIGTWDVSNVTEMESMFRSNTIFNQNLSGWDVSNVTNMQAMFRQAFMFNGRISTWDTYNVTDMSFMFHTANLFNQSLNNWNVENVTNMSYMFYFTGFNRPLYNWNVGNVTDMSFMFSLSAFNQDIGKWNVINVLDMTGMFVNNLVFNKNLNNWDVRNIPTEPVNFAPPPAALTELNKPIWGKIPIQNYVIFGDGPPTDFTTGQDDNLYLDMIGSATYGPRLNGIWPTSAPLVPPDTQIDGIFISGMGEPNPGLGDDDQFYIDTTTGQIYGPKTMGNWPTPTSTTGVLFSGSGAPTGSIGFDGSFYVDSNTGQIYGPKSMGVWSNTIGSPNKLFSGPNAPLDSVGTNGSFYLDTTTGHIYGPKVSGAWPTAPIKEEPKNPPNNIPIIVTGVLSVISLIAVIGLLIFMFIR